MLSLTVCSRTRKRQEYNLNVRTSKVRWEPLKYLVTFSLLAVTQLDTWHASSRTRAIIWSILDLGAASDSPLAKLLMHGAAQCIANLGARSLLGLASQGAFLHLPCGLADRLHNLHHLHLWRCAHSGDLQSLGRLSLHLATSSLTR